RCWRRVGARPSRSKEKPARPRSASLNSTTWVRPNPRFDQGMDGLIVLTGEACTDLCCKAAVPDCRRWWRRLPLHQPRRCRRGHRVGAYGFDRILKLTRVPDFATLHE